MAWPLDAVDVTYSANQPVTSDNLNEIQERIVDLHRTKTIAVWQAYGTNWTEGVDGWVKGGAGDLIVPIPPLPVGSIITAVTIKHYNADVGACAALCTLDSYQSEFGGASAPSEAPCGSVEVIHATTTWGVATITSSLPHTVAVGESFRLIVDDATTVAGDKIAGIQVTYQPITPTP